VGCVRKRVGIGREGYAVNGINTPQMQPHHNTAITSDKYVMLTAHHSNIPGGKHNGF
jgi:hypothetical protein